MIRRRVRKGEIGRLSENSICSRNDAGIVQLIWTRLIGMCWVSIWQQCNSLSPPLFHSLLLSFVWLLTNEIRRNAIVAGVKFEKCRRNNSSVAVTLIHFNFPPSPPLPPGNAHDVDVDSWTMITRRWTQRVGSWFNPYFLHGDSRLRTTTNSKMQIVFSIISFVIPIFIYFFPSTSLLRWLRTMLSRQMLIFHEKFKYKFVWSPPFGGLWRFRPNWHCTLHTNSV